MKSMEKARTVDDKRAAMEELLALIEVEADTAAGEAS